MTHNNRTSQNITSYFALLLMPTVWLAAVSSGSIARADLYWSGANVANSRDYSTPTNWSDTVTDLPSASLPTATIDIVWDSRFGTTATISPQGRVVVELDGTQSNQAGSLVVASPGYEVASNPFGEAVLALSGPLEITDGGRLYVDDGLTIDLRGGGSEGDLFLRSEAMSEFAALRMQRGDLFADDVVVEAGKTLSMSNSSELHARKLAIGATAFVGMGGRAGAVLSESILVDGSLSVFASHVTTPSLTVQVDGKLTGDQSSRTTPLVTGIVANSGVLFPGSETGFSTEFQKQYRTGKFMVEGDYHQTSGGTLSIDLNSENPASTDNPIAVDAHDLLAVSGDVELAGSLEVFLGPDLMISPGMAFTFLEIGGTRSGEFTGLTEGAVAYTDALTGFDLTITYSGGDGNDIALIVVPEPSALVLCIALGALSPLRIHIYSRRS